MVLVSGDVGSFPKTTISDIFRNISRCGIIHVSQASKQSRSAPTDPVAPSIPFCSYWSSAPSMSSLHPDLMNRPAIVAPFRQT